MLFHRQQSPYRKASSGFVAGVEFAAIERDPHFHSEEPVATARDWRGSAGAVVRYLQEAFWTALDAGWPENQGTGP